jgi:hypothetical protein
MLQRLLTFKVQNLISIFHCLCNSKKFVQVCVTLCNMMTFMVEKQSAPPIRQAGRLPLAGCLQMLIQCICSYPPYLESFSFVHNLWTNHAVVTWDPLNTAKLLCRGEGKRTHLINDYNFFLLTLQKHFYIQYNPDYPRQCGPRPPRIIENSDNTEGPFGVHKLLL